MPTETQRPAAVKPAAGPAPGMRLGRYELLRLLATGGMAEVWVARQVGHFGFRRNVAIKTIRPEYSADIAFRKMFLDEARLASLVRHANVAEVLDLGEEGDVVYQAIELIEGPTLKHLVDGVHARRGTGLPAPIAARIVVDALRGLHAAHELRDEQGIPLRLVHRDVSPHNILVGSDGLAKISDFGVAKALGRVADETEAGQVKGKYAYMSPEQLRRGPLDRRSDVFAAGVVLWETLTGRRLFAGQDVLDTAERVLSQPVVDPRELAGSIPEELALVTSKALSRAPDDRFETAEAMADAVERAVRLATGKELAAFVEDVTGETALAPDDPPAREDAPTATTLPPIGTVAMGPPKYLRRRRWPLALLSLPPIVAIALVSANRLRGASGDGGADVASASGAAPSVVTAGDQAEPAPPEEAPESSSLPAEDSSHTVDASVANATRRQTPSRPTRRPRIASPSPSARQPDPKFSNPY